MKTICREHNQRLWSGWVGLFLRIWSYLWLYLWFIRLYFTNGLRLLPWYAIITKIEGTTLYTRLKHDNTRSFIRWFIHTWFESIAIKPWHTSHVGSKWSQSTCPGFCRQLELQCQELHSEQHVTKVENVKLKHKNDELARELDHTGQELSLAQDHLNDLQEESTRLHEEKEMWVDTRAAALLESASHVLTAC